VRTKKDPRCFRMASPPGARSGHQYRRCGAAELKPFTQERLEGVVGQTVRRGCGGPWGVARPEHAACPCGVDARVAGPIVGHDAFNRPAEAPEPQDMDQSRDGLTESQRCQISVGFGQLRRTYYGHGA
jgi:hypothetical protein